MNDRTAEGSQALLSSLQKFNDYAQTLTKTSTKPLVRPELSHYCDLHALKSILTNNELWASNIRFLNDKEEMDYGIGVAKGVMKQLLDSRSSGAVQKKRRTWTIPNIPDVYAVCFCESPDLLSQWRGYGSSQQSVSIQFNGTELTTLGYLNAFRLQQIVYGADAASLMLQRALHLVDKKAADMVAMIISNESFDTAAEQTKAILRLSPQFKNEHFREENEWRLIADGEQLRPDYRPRDNVLLPYVKVKHPLTRPLPITQITVGPGKDSELTQKSIQHFLKSTTLYHGVRVEVSKIPFRV